VTLRLLRNGLLWLAGLIAVGVGVLYCMALYANRDRVSSFYIVGAELSDPIYLDGLERHPAKATVDREQFGFNVHRLKSGHGLVLAHRVFLGGGTAIDDELYAKLTIWMPAERAPGEQQTLQSSDTALIVYSSGASAWPRNDCSGNVNGRITIVPQGRNLDVTVEGEFQPNKKMALSHDCKARPLSLTFRAVPERFDQLTPWQGGIGAESPYDETYPGARKAPAEK